MDDYTILGIISDYEDTRLISVGELLEYVKSGKTCYSLKQYLDRRCSTDLQRFNFDPFNGDKIDWSKLRKIFDYE